MKCSIAVSLCEHCRSIYRAQLISIWSCLVSCVHQFSQLCPQEHYQRCSCARLSYYFEALFWTPSTYLKPKTKSRWLYNSVNLTLILIATLPWTLWACPRKQRHFESTPFCKRTVTGCCVLRLSPGIHIFIINDSRLLKKACNKSSTSLLG